MWTITLVCLAGFLVTLALAVYGRLATGATPKYLLETRAYELVPARGLIHSLLGLLLLAFAACLLLLVVKGVHLYTGDDRTNRGTITAAASGGALLPLGVAAWLLWARIGRLRKVPAPPIEVSDARFRLGIAGHVFRSLGTERFPNQIDPDRNANHGVRAVLLVLCLVGVFFAVRGLMHAYEQPPGGRAAVPLVRHGSTFLFELGLLLLWAGAFAGALLLAGNRDYTFFGFRISTGLLLLLAWAVVVGVLLVGATTTVLWVVLGAACLSWAARVCADYYRAIVYHRKRTAQGPLVESLRRLTPWLDRLTGDAAFGLPALSVEAVYERIRLGCQNVENRGGPFVTRHFSRFLQVVDADYHDCAMAVCRYLTWSRFVTEVDGRPEYASTPNQSPEVPFEDLRRFPLRPPSGYRAFTDHDRLGEEYDVVCWCRNCGGSGTVTRTVTDYHTEYYTEYYTDSQGHSQSRQASRQVATTRQVTETCGVCNGLCKQRFSQAINTRWRVQRPFVTDPPLPVPDLVEGCEEVTFLELPLTEDGRPASSAKPRMRLPRNPLVDEVLATLPEVVRAHAKNGRYVEEMNGDTLYRADFRLCGYRTIRIQSRQMRGRVGWFFGNRPEFYFPRLPLSWAALGTGLFLPPLVLLAAVGIGRLTLNLLDTPAGRNVAARPALSSGNEPTPTGADVEAFARQVMPAGDANDPNAGQWAPPPAGQQPADGIEGAWSNRWNRQNGPWTYADSGQVRTKDGRVYLEVRKGQAVYTIVLVREGNQLRGRYWEARTPRETGLFVGRVVDDRRIDGAWRGSDGVVGRWDFRR